MIRRALPFLATICFVANAYAADAQVQTVSSKFSSTEGEFVTGKKKEPVAAPVLKYPSADVIDDKNGKAVVKTLQGEVGIVVKPGMNVVFERDAKSGSSSETWIQFTEGIRVKGVEALDQFETGDIVLVTYKQPPDNTKRVVMSIELIKRKSKTEKEREAKLSEMEQKSDESQDETMASDG